MNKIKSIYKKIVITISVVLLVIILSVLGIVNGWFHTWKTNEVNYVDQKISDQTNYKTRKKVEDTCRAMIASYNSDCLTYKQYKVSDNEEKQSWAEQAKMRANKTASSYNNYILNNSFVWQGNIPEDINKQLDYIE